LLSLYEFQVFCELTKERFENLKHLREGLSGNCNIWLLVNNNLGLANALSYYASRRVWLVVNVIVSFVFMYHQP